MNAALHFCISTLRSLHRDESGQDLVEYALVAALIGLGSINAMKSLANYISNAFTTVGSSLVSAI
jgi:pilus assembly protein Flp/PilA